jgi:hypothetical protein
VNHNPETRGQQQGGKHLQAVAAAAQARTTFERLCGHWHGHKRARGFCNGHVDPYINLS